MKTKAPTTQTHVHRDTYMQAVAIRRAQRCEVSLGEHERASLEDMIGARRRGSWRYSREAALRRADAPSLVADYLTSLATVRVLALPDLRLMPAHGPVTSSAHQRVDELLHHHEERLSASSAAPRDGASTAAEVAELLPRDEVWATPRRARPLGHSDGERLRTWTSSSRAARRPAGTTKTASPLREDLYHQPRAKMTA